MQYFYDSLLTFMNPGTTKAGNQLVRIGPEFSNFITKYIYHKISFLLIQNREAKTGNPRSVCDRLEYHKFQERLKLNKYSFQNKSYL